MFFFAILLRFAVRVRNRAEKHFFLKGGCVCFYDLQRALRNSAENHVFYSGGGFYDLQYALFPGFPVAGEAASCSNHTLK